MHAIGNDGIIRDKGGRLDGGNSATVFPRVAVANTLLIRTRAAIRKQSLTPHHSKGFEHDCAKTSITYLLPCVIHQHLASKGMALVIDTQVTRRDCRQQWSMQQCTVIPCHKLFSHLLHPFKTVSVPYCPQDSHICRREHVEFVAYIAQQMTAPRESFCSS